LAIEEQFYFLWPWVLLLFLRTRRRLEIAAAGLAFLAVVAMLWSMYLASVAGVPPAESGLEGHAMGLLGGAALALVWHKVPEWRPTPTARRLLQVAAAACVFGILLASVLFRATASFTLATSVSTVLTLILIPLLLGVPEGPTHYLLSSRPAVWIGSDPTGFTSIISFSSTPSRR
jgi:peptidoglycan/LPS O-acetylase OafA/YrhL